MRERVQLLFTRSILFLSLFVLHFSFPFFVVYSKDSRLRNPPPSLSFSIFFFPSSLPLSLSLHSLRIIFSMTMSLPETYFFATRALRKGTTLHLNTAFFAMSWKCVIVNGDASPTITRTIYFTLVKAGLNFISARLPWGGKNRNTNPPLFRVKFFMNRNRPFVRANICSIPREGNNRRLIKR